MIDADDYDVKVSDEPTDMEELFEQCHKQSHDMGWWHDSVTGNSIKGHPLTVPTKLCLVHSEVSEAMEGHRRDKMDDHLPHRSMLETELADAVIRIADLAGAYNLDVIGAIKEKLAYNAERLDHQMTTRAAKGGKKY